MLYQIYSKLKKTNKDKIDKIIYNEDEEENNFAFLFSDYGSEKEQCEYFEAIIRKNYINHNEIKNKLLLKSENNANNKEKDFKESEVKKYLMVEQVKNQAVEKEIVYGIYKCLLIE